MLENRVHIGKRADLRVKMIPSVETPTFLASRLALHSYISRAAIFVNSMYAVDRDRSER